MEVLPGLSFAGDARKGRCLCDRLTLATNILIVYEVITVDEMMMNKRSYNYYKKCQIVDIFKGRLHTFFCGSERKSTNESVKAIMEIEMENLGEPAPAKAVTVSWNSSLKLERTPKLCVFMYQSDDGFISYRCKLGRILLHKETAKFPPLNFAVTSNDRQLNATFVAHFTASSASKMTPTESISVTLPFGAENFRCEKSTTNVHDESFFSHWSYGAGAIVIFVLLFIFEGVYKFYTVKQRTHIQFTCVPNTFHTKVAQIL